jgi:hypothetical protein
MPILENPALAGQFNYFDDNNEPFAPVTFSSCDAIQSTGSTVLLSPLKGCNSTPLSYRIVFRSIQAQGSIPTNAYYSAEVRIANKIENGVETTLATTSPVSNFYLRKSQIIRLNNGKLGAVKFSPNQISSAVWTRVWFQPIPNYNFFDGTEDAFNTYSEPFYENLNIISLNELSFGFNDTVQESTDITESYQGSSKKTGSELKTQIQFRCRPDDIAYHYYLFPAQKQERRLYCLYQQGEPLNNGHKAYGAIEVANLQSRAAAKSFLTGSCDILFQTPYATLSDPNALSAAKKLAYENVCKAFGVLF